MAESAKNMLQTPAAKKEKKKKVMLTTQQMSKNVLKTINRIFARTESAEEFAEAAKYLEQISKHAATMHAVLAPPK